MKHWSILFVLILPFFYGIQAIRLNTLGTFVFDYLHNIQKYLFNQTILVLFVIYDFFIPIKDPLIATRILKDKYRYICKFIITNTFKLTLLIYISFTLSIFMLRLNTLIALFDWRILLQLFFFIFTCHSVCLAIYLKTEEVVFSIVVLLLSNIFILAVFLSLDYFIFQNDLLIKNEFIILNGYLILQNILSFGSVVR